jgi:hypothetical protein
VRGWPVQSSHFSPGKRRKCSHERVLGYFIFPRPDEFTPHLMVRNAPFLVNTARLHNLSEFYDTVGKVWAPTRITEHKPTSGIFQ